MGQDTRSGAREAVTVIMPTLARADRADLLRAALRSILSQTGVQPLALIVVNGPDRDPDLVAELERSPGVRLIERDAADLGEALHAGRAAVETEWFAELDDDDLLLPGALAARLARLRASPGAVAVVSDGWVQSISGRRRVIEDVDATAADPLGALVETTWLSPGGALFRTSAVPAETFLRLPRYLEWTCLALRLARLGVVEFVDMPTFVHREGSPQGLWGSPECVLGLPDAISHLVETEVDAVLRPGFVRRLASACNTAANLERRRGRWRAAWRWHLRCLGHGGWRYLSFTRRLLPGFRQPGDAR